MKNMELNEFRSFGYFVKVLAKSSRNLNKIKSQDEFIVNYFDERKNEKAVS